MNGTLGLIQLMIFQFCSLHLSQLLWPGLDETVLYSVQRVKQSIYFLSSFPES